MATTTKKQRTSRARKAPAKKGQQAHTAKGRLRREKLRASAAKLLKKFSYHELTLEQIASAADIPTSVFYHYFSNKRELVLELLEEVFNKFEHTVLGAGPFGSFENGLTAHNRELLRLYAENAGLMRCLNEVNELEFAQSWRHKMSRWHEIVMSGLVQFTNPKFKDKDELRSVVIAMSGLTETVATELYVKKNTSLRALLPDIESATAFVSTMWVRSLFLKPGSNVSEGMFKTLKHLADIEA